MRIGRRRLKMSEGKYFLRALSAILVRSLRSALRELRNEAKKYFIFNGWGTYKKKRL